MEATQKKKNKKKKLMKSNDVLVSNRIREMVSFEFIKEIEKDVFCLVTSVRLRIFSSSHAHEKMKKIFLYVSFHYNNKCWNKVIIIVTILSCWFKTKFKYIYVHNITLTRWYKYMLKPNVLTVEFLSHQFHLCFYQRMSHLGKTKNTLC